MVAWTTTDTFKFIEIYQNEPCIWNPTNKYHKDKIKVNEAWLRISDGMDIPVDEIKKKKETLLSAFRLNRKKVLASRTSGGEDEFKPIWIYYDALAAFMTDVYECKSTSTTSEDHLQYAESFVEVESSHASSTEDCDLYGRLLAQKLRQFTELDRLDLMYQIDGMILKKRRLLDREPLSD